uniref:Uncharacterized protein n=1 Tax=Solanum lycopersicum TaxID=4081 RepID=A0A3Q7H1C3_SOLLC
MSPFCLGRLDPRDAALRDFFCFKAAKVPFCQITIKFLALVARIEFRTKFVDPELSAFVFS